MITPNDFRAGSLIKWKDGIYEVLSYKRSRTAQRRARVVAKIRNISTGVRIEESFDSELKLDEAEMERRRSQFMYEDDMGCHFMDSENYEQFALDADAIGDKKVYLVEDAVVDIVYVEGVPTTFQPPMFVEMEVVETEPSHKGDTATGGNKPARLTTGLVVTVPVFVKTGDRVRVDTRDDSYVERVS